MGGFKSLLSYGSGLLNTAGAIVDKAFGGTGLVKSAVGSLTSWADREQAKSDLNDARNWQMFTQNQANQFAHDEAQLARDFNSLEAQKNRDFQSLETEKARQQSRQWQLEDWERETAYNSPAHQLQLMQEAGLNPLLFNESVSNQGMPSAISPTSPIGSAASSSPAVSSMSSLAIPNPSLISAQTRLANAQADKAESDVDVNKETANRIRSLLDGELKQQYCTILTSFADLSVKEATAKKLNKESEKIDSEVQVLSQQVANMQQELLNMQKQGLLTDKEIEAIDQRLRNEFMIALSEVNRNNAAARLSQHQIEQIADQMKTEEIMRGRANFEWMFEKETYRSRCDAAISAYKSANADSKVDMGDVTDVNGWQLARGIMRAAGSVLGGVTNSLIKAAK